MGVVSNMSGKPVCLVLGAGRGIGYSVARKWAKMGHQVIITRRSEVSQEDLEREVGVGVVAMQCDVTGKDQVEKTVDEVENKFGPIATVIYNAGNGVWKNYENIHVFYTIVDGLVKAGSEDGSKYMNPDDIADTYWDVASQKRSAWTFEVDMRPFCEDW